MVDMHIQRRGCGNILKVGRRGETWDLPFKEVFDVLGCCFMVNDSIGELLDLDRETRLESLWWTSTYKNEDMTKLRVGSGGKLGTWAVVSTVMEGAERAMCKGMGSSWRDRHIYRSKSVPNLAKCRSVLENVHSTALKVASIGRGVVPCCTRYVHGKPRSYVLLSGPE